MTSYARRTQEPACQLCSNILPSATTNGISPSADAGAASRNAASIMPSPTTKLVILMICSIIKKAGATSSANLLKGKALVRHVLYCSKTNCDQPGCCSTRAALSSFIANPVGVQCVRVVSFAPCESSARTHRSYSETC